MRAQVTNRVRMSRHYSENVAKREAEKLKKEGLHPKVERVRESIRLHSKGWVWREMPVWYVSISLKEYNDYVEEE